MTDHQHRNPTSSGGATTADSATVMPLDARRVLRDVGAGQSAAQAARDAAMAAPWDAPVPLTPVRVRPPFPVETLPTWLRAMVDEVTEALQVPTDLPATLALACLAVAAGGRVDVAPVPGWVEPTNLYTVVALVPGSRKSPAFSAMTRPLYAAETALCEATEPARIEATLMARRARAHAERTATAAENTDTDEAMAEAIAAARAAHEHDEPPEPRLLADDLTPETAATLLARHDGRLALMSAEGGSFSTIAGTRYSAAANLEPLLKAHAGDMIRIDRKGRPSERIERPALTIAITTQPGHLASIANTPEARERGLLARFLYSLPTNTVGNRQIHPAPVTDITRQAYETRLSRLVLDLALTPERVELDIDNQARTVLADLETWLEPRLHPETGELAAVTDWASKMAGTAVRIAGLVHLAHHGTNGRHAPITGDTMTAAVTIARYYLAHTLAVFDTLTADPDLDAARRVLDWIARTRPDTFTRRELHRGIKSQRFPKPESVDPAIRLLLDHGLIRDVPEPKKGGRPSPTYQTHPDL